MKACYKGFYYIFHKYLKGDNIGIIRYQCEECNRVGVKCRGFIWVLNGRVTKEEVNEHAHESNAARVHHLQVSRNSKFLQKSQFMYCFFH